MSTSDRITLIGINLLGLFVTLTLAAAAFLPAAASTVASSWFLIMLILFFATSALFRLRAKKEGFINELSHDRLAQAMQLLNLVAIVFMILVRVL